MAKATRVLSTPPTSTSPSRIRCCRLLEESIFEVFHMANIVDDEMRAADGTACLQQLDRLVFCVRHLCRMVEDLHTEYFERTEVFSGKAVA